MADPFNAVDPVRKTFFIRESERDAGTPSNNAGKVPQLESDGKLSSHFWLRGGAKYTLPSLIAIDGSTIPVPVGIQSNGTIVPSKADGDAKNQNFHGFTKDVIASSALPVFVNADYTNGLGGGFSFTANAGSDRLLVVFASEETGATLSNLQWDGNAMTEVISAGGGYGTSIWIYALRDSGTNQTANITGSASNSVSITAVVFADVDQSTPQIGANTNESGSVGVTISELPYTLVAYAKNFSESTSLNSPSGLTGIDIGQPQTKVAYKEDSSSPITVSQSGGGTNSTAGIALKGANSGSDMDVIVSGILDGFSSLTPGARYYVQDTAGTIGITPGSNTILVGKALSATELLILHD